MLKNKLLKRLSLLFIFLSLVLWGVKVSIFEENIQMCNLSLQIGNQYSENGVEQKKQVTAAEDQSKWLRNKLSKLTSSHWKTQSSCPALNASLGLSLSPSSLSDFLPHSNTAEYFGTLSAIGDLHIRLGWNKHELVAKKEIIHMMGNISDFLKDPRIVLTSFSTFMHKSDNPRNILRVLSDMGIELVVSLANTALSSVTSDDDGSATARALEEAGVQWLGLRAKKHHIVVLHRQRVGLLGFCGVHRECADGNELPFSPIRYTFKVAKSAISELKEHHGVTQIIVMMYWGLETGYFPDETALTIARQLAMLGVTAVLGYHPSSVQNHVYFGDTLVIFSLGKSLSSDKVVNYCWKKISREWKYSSTKICNFVHPTIREKLHQRESQTRIYRIHLSLTHPAVAEYVTIDLEDFHKRGYTIRRPVVTTGHHKWTDVCGSYDLHCLGCKQF